VIEISRSRLSDIGIKFPSQLTFTASASPLTFDALRQINGSTIGVSPAPAVTLNAMLQDSDSNILSSPRLRVRNREKAKIMIGERVPMITNSITPVATGAPVITGTVTYQDVGLKLEVEPEIHLDNEVTIKVGLEVSSLGLAVSNGSGSTVYRVGTRNTSTSLRLRDGETQILAGLITDDDRSTVDKVPALGQIPLLGHLFASDNSTKAKTEIILSITPHLVGNSKLADARETEYWSGTESALRSNQIMLKPLGAVALNSSANTPAGMPIPYNPAPNAALPVNATPPVNTALPVNATSPANASPSATVIPPAVASKTVEPPAAQTMALSWQGPNQAKVGDKITLILNTPSSQGVKTLGLQFEFDPEVLKAVDVTEGDSLKRNNSESNLTKNIDQSSGNVTVDLSGAGSSGNASVVSLTFEVIAPAQGTSVSINSLTATGLKGEGLSLTAPEPHVITLTQ
jgi:general secretion pathway protein D